MRLSSKQVYVGSTPMPCTILWPVTQAATRARCKRAALWASWVRVPYRATILCLQGFSYLGLEREARFEVV
jgi:hypothetical protein